MITLAIDTASDRLTLAATDGTATVSRHLDGARGHARAVLGLVGEALADLDAGARDVRHLLTGDGPGSFTGLRVSAAVAKAMTWGRRDVTWSTAPSLLVRAARHAPSGGGRVLALADALRGELYAGCWRFTGAAVVHEHGAARTTTPEALAAFGPVDLVVGSVPERLLAAVQAATGRPPVLGEAALPDARALLALDRLAGGTQPVADPAAWQPTYGRPVEAQAVWERKHGRPLPDSTHRVG